MKKLFLIPLMACAMLFSTNLQAEVRTAGTFAELQAALTAAVDGDEIQLTADINYGYAQAAGAINITKSITLNGQGHTLTGASVCAADGTPATIGVNYGGGNTVNATIKDLTLVNANPSTAHKLCAIYYTNGNGSNSITCDNVVMDVRDAKKGNSAVFQAGGSGTAVEDVTLNNCHLLGKSNDYPVKVFVPLNIDATKSYFLGYCSVYFKPGSKGSALNADECQFDAPNVYSGRTNDFAVFPMEDTGLTFVLNNCSMNAQQLGNQSQPVFCLSEWTKDADRTGNVDITIKGDNTYINCQSEWISNNYWWPNPDGNVKYGPNDAHTITTAEAAVDVNVHVQILGGTFSVNPENMIYGNNMYADAGGDHYDKESIELPEGYTCTAVTTNQDGEETTLYRVHETATTDKNLNDNNIADKNIKVDEDITLNNDVTTKYVEVDNGATVTVPAGKTLELTNGFVVNAGGQIVVEPGATVIVGEGGAIAANADGIVLEADENGVAGNLIMDPEVKLNTTPRVTVRFQSKAYKDGDTRVYHFFGSPMKSVESFTSTSATAKTWLDMWDVNKWDYFGSINDDKAIDYSKFGKPFAFICMSSDNAAGALQTYTMTGNLFGIDEPSVKVYAGWSGMANSYMGAIDIDALWDANVAATNNGSQVAPAIYTYEQVGNKLSWNVNNPLQQGGISKIAPMQPFMLKNDGDWEDRTLSYKDLVWTPATTKSPAPARRQVAADMTKATLRVEAADGLYDMLTVAESPEFSAGKDLYDAEKYMNSDLNFYVTDSKKMNVLATDNLDNTYLGFSCIEAGTYTISFNNIEGNTLTLVDLQNNQVIDMTEGATYTFSAAANESNDYRFKLVSRREVVTDVEEVENAAVRTGVYTLTGQYMGEMNIWNTLPAGIYVVNGEKRVK